MEAVLNWLWQGGVVAMASWLMLLALERARANLRYLVCWAALFAVIALPVLPAVQWSAVPIDALRVPKGAAMISLGDTSWTSTLVLLAAWMAWGSVHLMKSAAAVGAIRRARARSAPFPSHRESPLPEWNRVRATGRGATLVLSESVATAAVLGCGAPMIAVSPALIETLDASDLDRVLIHEWAHVQRRDDLVYLVQIAVRALVGWHPAAWWIDRRLHVEREIACDERTVAITGSPKTYAQCLVQLATVTATRPTMHAAPAILTSRGLRARVTRIVSAPPSLPVLWSRAMAVAIVSVLCLMPAAIGGLTLVEEATGLVLPILSPPTPGSRTQRLAATASPASALALETDRRSRTVTMRVPRNPQAEQVASPPSIVAPDEPVTPPGGHALDSVIAAETNPEPPVLPALTSVPPIPLDAAEMTAEKSRTPWIAAADSGVAIGRKSKGAGLATAGFFTRFGRRVAGTF
jgi:D-alanyl-D-alanine endopeptidase (penicillin-binding protein 7)